MTSVKKPVSLPLGEDAPMCSCHSGHSCDVSHDPEACSCRQCVRARATCVLFRPDDGFPECEGWMIGPDDGKSPLYPTPEEAVKAHVEKKPA